MKTNSNCSLLTKEVVSILNHPVLNTEPKLRKFLEEFGVSKRHPNRILVAKDYFDIDHREFRKRGGKHDTYDVILFSDEGVKFVEELAGLLY